MKTGNDGGDRPIYTFGIWPELIGAAGAIGLVVFLLALATGIR